MSAVPPDPRGVAGLAVTALREYADLQDMAIASDGTFPVRLNGTYSSASLRAEADRLEALAASPVSQPTVGGEVPTLAQIDNAIEATAEEYEWRGDDGDYMPNEQERAMLVDFSHGILANEEIAAMLRAHFATPPASVEPVSQDAEPYPKDAAAALAHLEESVAATVATGSEAVIISFMQAGVMAQALRRFVPAAARQEKGR